MPVSQLSRCENNGIHDPWTEPSVRAALGTAEGSRSRSPALRWAAGWDRFDLVGCPGHRAGGLSSHVAAAAGGRAASKASGV